MIILTFLLFEHFPTTTNGFNYFKFDHLTQGVFAFWKL